MIFHDMSNSESYFQMGIADKTFTSEPEAYIEVVKSSLCMLGYV